MKEFFERIWHPKEGLKIIETCPNRPENYIWQKRAWFEGKTHLIEPSGFEVVDKGHYTYQIATFTFTDEVAAKATGAHFYIPEGRANNVILFTDEKYHWQIRAVSGSGWILAWHKKTGVRQAWLSPDLENNPVIEFSKDWIATLIASPDCGQFVVEGIDRPEYIETAETLIPLGQDNLTGESLHEFWDSFNRLTSYQEFPVARDELGVVALEGDQNRGRDN